MSPKLFYLIVASLLLMNCAKPERDLTLQVDLPIPLERRISLFNISSGKEIYNQELSTNTLELDSLDFGIYLINIMWKRDLLSFHEFKQLKPHDIDSDRFFSIEKLIFIDPNESTVVIFNEGDSITREILEQRLVNKQEYFSPKVEIRKGNASKLFNKFDKILDDGRKRYYREQDSLKRLLYTYNDLGEIEESKKILAQNKVLWKEILESEVDVKEREFLLENNSSIIVPFVLMHKVVDRQTYNSLQDVINNLPKKYHTESFVNSLEKYKSN